MIYEHLDFKTFLRAVLVEKISRNPSYSLRAMAKNLDVSPSTLSEMIRGKRNLSVERAMQIAAKLGLDSAESEYFCLLVQRGQVKDPGMQEIIQKRMQSLNPEASKINNLSVDLFRMIADWYHSAILHLCDLKDFNFKSTEIAQRLGITVFEAEAAIERLLRLELLSIDENGHAVRTNDFLAEATIPNESLRKFHKQTLEKAIDSLQSQTPSEKLMRTETITIDPALLPQADQLMEEFVAKLNLLFKKSENKTDVYHLGIQFFNLTKKRSRSHV